MYDDLKTIGKEAVEAYSKVLFRCLPGMIENLRKTSVGTPGAQS
jgi:hypothetical protein